MIIVPILTGSRRPLLSQASIAAWLAMTLVFCCGDGVQADQPERLLLTGKYAEAAEEFTALASTAPLRAALGLSQCQAAQGKSTAALKTLTVALKQFPDAPPPERATLIAHQAQIQFDAGQRTDALDSVKASLELDSQQLLARWLTAELARVSGDLDAADKACKWFVDYHNSHEITDPAALRYIGLAAANSARWNRLTNEFSFLVNKLYPAALKADPDFWPAHYETGKLYLEKYNLPEAKRSLAAALAINPHSAEVHTALARLALEEYDLGDVRTFTLRALAINPRYLPALWLRADAHLASADPRGAIEVLEEARKLNPVADETLGRLGAAYVAIDGHDPQMSPRLKKLIEEVSARNARPGEFYAAIGDGLDQLRRYAAAAEFYELAVKTEPRLPGAYGALGLMHMRLGDETAAREILETAFDIDPFNTRIANQLAVLDVLADYAVIETEHFVVKFDRGQDELLAKSMSDYLENQVYPELTKQFGYRPTGKSLFEIFNRSRSTGGHGWFSARVAGVPFVGTVGACAGQMVAIVSPSAMPRPFNWARVARHEFVHVLNLQQTDFAIPHWFTEALAVRSEGMGRPPDWIRLLARRSQTGELYNLDNINFGFARPGSGDDWTLAYCQAELYAEYLVHAHGEAAIAGMLNAYRDGLNTATAIEKVAGVSQADFEKGYTAYLQDLIANLPDAIQTTPMSLSELLAAQAKNPDDAGLATQLAIAYLDRESYSSARRLAEKVLHDHPGDPAATYVLARLQLVTGDTATAVQLLEGVVDERPPHERSLLLLAALKMKARDFPTAAQLYLLGKAEYPADMQWTQSLARVYLATGERDKLAPLLAELAQVDYDDAALRKKLAQLANAQEDHAGALKWAQAALQIDVTDASLHEIVARSASAIGQTALACREFEVCVSLTPDDNELRVEYAAAMAADGKPDAARDLLNQILADAPDHAAARRQLETLSP